MDLLLPWVDLLCAGALGESNRLYTPGCIVPGSLVGKKADHNAPSDPNCSFCYSWCWHGVTRGLVGTLPSGDEPRPVYLSQPDRASPRRKPGCLVLSEQNLLAVQSHLYLSEMEHLTGGFNPLHLVACGHRCVRGDLLHQAIFRTQCR